jgi:hypothetical protein
MSPLASAFLQNLIETGKRPFLSDPADREAFYRNQLSFITRQINRLRKGRATKFSSAELGWLFREISQLITDLQNDPDRKG